MNTKFVVRGVFLALPIALVAILAGLIVIVAQTPIGRPPAPTPLSPTILLPRGETPQGSVAFEEWVRYRGRAHALAGSGFLISLDGGEIVGVTTAHSASSGNLDHPLEWIALRPAGETDYVAEFGTLRGRPGRPLEGYHMTMDYLLLHTDQPIDPGLILVVDPRGAPQLGERVWLFSGQGSTLNDPRVLEGTVQSVGENAVWVLMDGFFNPSLTSGSPMVSQHTGQVVGMVIAVTLRRNRLLMGVHPIGSIVRLAESATEYLPMDEYP